MAVDQCATLILATKLWLLCTCTTSKYMPALFVYHYVGDPVADLAWTTEKSEATIRGAQGIVVEILLVGPLQQATASHLSWMLPRILFYVIIHFRCAQYTGLL
jgi:hypothetical protein